MASKIGVYFDVQNIGGGLDVEALAEQVRSKWSDLTPVVKVRRRSACRHRSQRP